MGQALTIVCPGASPHVFVLKKEGQRILPNHVLLRVELISTVVFLVVCLFCFALLCFAILVLCCVVLNSVV